MGPDFEWKWDVARYRNMLPDPRAQLCYDAVRQAHEMRHAEFHAVFKAMLKILRNASGALARRARRAALWRLTGTRSTMSAMPSADASATALDSSAQPRSRYSAGTSFAISTLPISLPLAFSTVQRTA